MNRKYYIFYKINLTYIGNLHMKENCSDANCDIHVVKIPIIVCINWLYSTLLTHGSTHSWEVFVERNANDAKYTQNLFRVYRLLHSS